MDVYLEAAEHDKEHTLKYLGKGDYQCYCRQVDLENIVDIYIDSNNLCHYYWWDTINAWIFDKSIALLVVIMNLIL